MILDKNMHVKLINSICRACFDFVSIMTDCLSMHRAYMAHTRKGAHFFDVKSWKDFSILITPQGVDALLVSQYLIVNGVKYGYDFRAIKQTNMLILLVLSG